jgi:hypothetical protein
MKLHTILFLLLFAPAIGSAQNTRKGTYGNLAVGYGTYRLDLYEYAGGRNLYNDQKFSGFILSLGVGKKSAWTKDQLVFDVDGELTGGFGISGESTATGNLNGKTSGGYLLGLKGLFKMGYQLQGKQGPVIPLVGLGPYYNYLNSGGENAVGNYIYGLQGSIGVDFPLSKILLTPEIHFGLASWGSSDEMDQNGQPGFFEIRLKIGRRF